jgi:hypothetical protein
MDIKSVLSRLTLSNPSRVARKAMELSRRCEVRCQSGYSTLFLRGAATCQGALCVDLACKLCGDVKHGFKTRDFAKIGGVPLNIYERTMQSIVHVLGVEFPVSLEELSVRFGAATVRLFAEKVLDLYRKRVQAQKRERGELSVVIETSSSLHAAAALYVCAKSLDVKMSLDELIAVLPGVSKDGVNALCTSLIETCGDILRDGCGFRKEAKKRRGRKKKEDTSKSAKKNSSIVGCSMISLHPPSTLQSKHQTVNEKITIENEIDGDRMPSMMDADSFHQRGKRRKLVGDDEEEEEESRWNSAEFIDGKDVLDEEDQIDVPKGDEEDDDEDDDDDKDKDDEYEEWKQRILQSSEEKKEDD